MADVSTTAPFTIGTSSTNNAGFGAQSMDMSLGEYDSYTV